MLTMNTPASAQEEKQSTYRGYGVSSRMAHVPYRFPWTATVYLSFGPAWAVEL